MFSHLIFLLNCCCGTIIFITKIQSTVPIKVLGIDSYLHAAGKLSDCRNSKNNPRGGRHSSRVYTKLQQNRVENYENFVAQRSCLRVGERVSKIV